MSSSTFEVKESESDSEQVIDFGLDACEENGVMSSQLDGDVPKDHTYTKEPSILEDEELKENEDLNNQLDENNMDSNNTPVERPKTTKTSKTKSVKKPPARGKAKKIPSTKKEPPAPKKGKSKKDDVIADVVAVTEDLAKENEKDSAVVEGTNIKTTKPAKRGRKRKTEEKENEPSQDSAGEPASNTEDPPKKKNATTKRAKSAPDKATKPKVLSSDDIIDNQNLPKGWIRKTVVRKSGKSAGQKDIYIYSPDGYKFRSKPEIVNFLKRTNSNLKIDDFDFSKKSAVLKNSTVKAAVATKSPKKKPAPVKTKPPAAKKKEVASPKKTPKLLVKIVSERKKKLSKKSTKQAVKPIKTSVKGKKTATKVAVKGSKKKKA